MSSVVMADPDGGPQGRNVSMLVFFLFVFSSVLLCMGILLSIFGYQACQYDDFPKCSIVLKVAGPLCAMVGLGAVILARSQARLQLLVGCRPGGSQADSGHAFLCGESRQFAQCLIFGFLFLTSGLLISILGLWVPRCSSDWAPEPLNKTHTADTKPQICGFLSLQILGPLIVLMGLCFFVVAHVKKKTNLSASQDDSESDQGHTSGVDPVQVSVGDSVILFPPPPPPYFAECPVAVGDRPPGADSMLPADSPPSYCSLFNHGAPGASGLVYTISGTDFDPEGPHGLPLSSESESPPSYEPPSP
ncbi:transmembrane protein 171 [Ctenodactylus gundi]